MVKQRDGLVRFDPEKLERQRLKLGMSKNDLALKANVSRNRVIKICEGEGCFPSTAKLIVEALDCELKDLLHGDQHNGVASFQIPDTEEWKVVEYLHGWQTASNGLQYRVCKMQHKADTRQFGRGKFYDLLGLHGEQREKLRHYLVRHFQVCGRVKTHDHVAENLSCVAAGDGTGWWLIDRWVDGSSLAECLAKGPWAASELVTLMTQIASGLAVLHEAGIVFRELAPQRVLITGQRKAILTDFELAKFLEQAPSVSSKWPGDPYRAPEVESGRVTAQADLYSWGRIFVHAATGNLPAPGTERTALRELGTSRSLTDMVLACLSVSFRKRPESMKEILHVLLHTSQVNS